MCYWQCWILLLDGNVNKGKSLGIPFLFIKGLNSSFRKRNKRWKIKQAIRMQAERKRGEIRGEVRTQGASSCDLVSCVRAESELWLQALLGPQPWGRRLSAMWLTVPMKLASPAKLQSDAEFPQAVLRKNGTWRTASYKNPSGRRHTVFEAFTGGITRRKVIFFSKNFLFVSLYFLLSFNYGWIYTDH